jgi:hypothetical protein
MRAHRIALSLAISIACGIAGHPAFSDEYRGTLEQRLACAPDVFRLCSSQIPDSNRIVACLRQNTAQLSGVCREVFDSNASAARQPAVNAPRQSAPRRRDDWSTPGYDQ